MVIGVHRPDTMAQCLEAWTGNDWTGLKPSGGTMDTIDDGKMLAGCHYQFSSAIRLEVLKILR